MTSAQIRKQFLDFFHSKHHHLVPSAPIVVKDDPTLMFTNAGMNQFKDYFLGNRQAPWPRAADTQKCLRVSGKHNDLEEVGVDTYHHTMFEMLGNWSFGDPSNPSAGYFKKEAIEWSWELLTKVFQLPEDRLYVTVFGGNEAENISGDTEALEEWKKWMATDRILPFGKKENFWEMGDTGPCGPCTEIHVDTRPDAERKVTDGKTLVNADHPQVIEIWNNVFIQYNRLKDGSLELLPARHVDTGMGLERLVRVIQGKNSNYDTDVFSGTIEKIAGLTQKIYQKGTNQSDIAFRVLADHIRAISFTIADGQLPSNTGAGYVIRRILRRAVRYYYSYLHYPQPLLFQLVPVIAQQFEDIFPELKKQEQFVMKVIHEEEEAFLRTLEKGLKRMEDFLSHSSSSTISGQDAFDLYDTYGFPLDLTVLIAGERNFKVNEQDFTREMQKQKDRSRAASIVDTGDWTIISEGNSNTFIGYDTLVSTAQVLRYRKVKTKNKEAWQVVLDKTPFYAESGGQVGDNGTFMIGAKEYTISDTRKENELIVHIADELPKDLHDEITACVNVVNRKLTAVHHTSTHLLHAALRQVLGNHVTQKGSLVNARNLRFDFSHFSKLSEEEIRQVEMIINDKIRQNIQVNTQYLPRDEAMKTGAMALFGEKYGETVRVITIDPEFSKELCGGTHVGSTGELGYFRILTESAVAAGVRRIEAIGGVPAEQYAREQGQLLHSIKELLKNPTDISKSILTMRDENEMLKKSLEKFEGQQLRASADRLSQKAQPLNGCNFLGELVEATHAEALKKLAFELKHRIAQPVIVLAAAIEGKAHVVLLFDEEIVKQKHLDAAALVKQKIGPLIRGGGGGQKNLATAGGQDATALHLVIETVKSLL